VLTIINWPMSNVHSKRCNRSLFTGKMSREAMEEEHAEELHALEAGEQPTQVPEEVVNRRKRLFWPYAVVMTVLLVGGLLFFISFETSAITTVPRRNVEVFAPQVLPESGDAAVGAALWPTLRCARCHGQDARGGSEAPAIVNTELTFEEFHLLVRTGRDEMPAFGPEELPDAYLLHLWTWLKGDGNVESQ
jgi:hypothetical protein